MKGILKVLLIVSIIVTALVLASACVVYMVNKVPPNGPVEGTIFTVEQGENLQSIAERLEESDLIRSGLFLRAVSRFRNTETSFQAGSYMVPAGSSALSVHNVLVSGTEVLHRVTIPEGWTISRISKVLDGAGITSADEFILAAQDADLLSEFGIQGNSAEGFLFPDTYLLPKSYPADKIVRHMVEKFFKILDDIGTNYKALTKEELYKKVVLASIIEREYGIPDEAPYMASVFYNRLAIEMKLQSCATVAYALSEELGEEYPEALTLRDLEVESRYNTYLYSGMPPGPISNPGRYALEAVFFPEETDYLFFLLKNPETGEHEFTAEYGQHLNAKNLYLKKS